MILIVSSHDDFSTNEIIDWLLYYKHPFLRISQDDLIEIENIEIQNNDVEFFFQVKGKRFSNKNFPSVWYRRSWLSFAEFNIQCPKIKSVFNQSIHNQLLSEKNVIYNFVNNNLFRDSINTPFDCNINKLLVLQIAKKIGLVIPYTKIITRKKDLLALTKKYNKLITKTQTGGVFVGSSREKLNTLTLEVSEEMIAEMPDRFFPTLFQEQIEKKIELRVFFLENQFFASAIFSQYDKQTSVDFRNYNFKHPNRTPPYMLPHDIQEKLKQLMSALHLNSGSIDLILSSGGEYVFLEVNPIGQFKQVSKPCNYHLERLIAKRLIDKDKE
ncbi:MAG: grasp-with-spasm system ATP-grasp peptide maturase [Bacteroidales bacterium]|jgi:ATP-GRASP peptide maturase of grasp-with-spasm system|nr:grasp-with-spasm system ATP-grasp peptide maturase [Bacteroidales bacterium]